MTYKDDIVFIPKLKHLSQRIKNSWKYTIGLKLEFYEKNERCYVTSIQTHDNLCFPNFSCHAVSVIITVNSCLEKVYCLRISYEQICFWVSWVNQLFKFHRTLVIGLSGCHALDTKHE